MNRKDNMRYQERILWVEGVETNNFTVDISGLIPQDCYELTVELSMCYISYFDANIFNAEIIRILGNFNVGHNQRASSGNQIVYLPPPPFDYNTNNANNKFISFDNSYIRLGIINNPLTQSNSSLEIIQTNTLPRYFLSQSPILINFLITNESYENLVSVTTSVPPARIVICLTFSYYI